MVTLGFAFDLLTNFGTTVTKVLAHLLRRPEAIPISAEECFYCKEWAEELRSRNKRTMFLYYREGGIFPFDFHVARRSPAIFVWRILGGTGGLHI